MNEFEGWNKILLEWHEVNRMKRLNQELYDLLGGMLLHNIEFARRNKIPLANGAAAIVRIHELMDEINAPTKLNNQNKHPDNEQKKKLLPFCQTASELGQFSKLCS